MPRLAQPLTAAKITKVKAKQTISDLADGRGLFFRTHPSGRKTWVFRYKRPDTGKTTNWAFGGFPELSLAEAREQREHFLRAISQGTDPQAKPEGVETVALAFEKYLSHQAGSVSEARSKEMASLARRHIVPVMGNIDIKVLTTAKAVDALEYLKNDGKLETLRRTAQILVAVMDHAHHRGVIDHNPIARLGRAFRAPKSVPFPMVDIDDIPTLLRDFHMSNATRAVKVLFMFQLHTLTRPNEAAHACWSEIDMQERIWSIPAERMKGRTSHVIPLTDEVIKLLEAHKDQSPVSEFVFPSWRQAEPLHKETVTKALARAGYKGRQVAHSLRALAATTMGEVGHIDDGIIDRCLAHQPRGTVTRSFSSYARGTRFEERQQAHAWWSKYLHSKFIEGLAHV